MQHHATIVRSNVFWVRSLMLVSVFGALALSCVFACCREPRCMAGKKPQRLAASQLHSFDENRGPGVMRQSPTNYVLLILYTLAVTTLEITEESDVFWCVLMYFVKRQSGTIHICCACLLLGCSMCFVHSDVRIVHLPQKFFGNAAQMDSHAIELWGKARRVRFWNCSVFLLSNAH